MGNKTDENLTTDIRFSIVPEWVLDAEISDRALRVYAVLARYADNDTLQAFPGRQTIADRVRCSVKSVDRALDELIEMGAIEKQHRVRDGVYKSSLFTVIRVGVASGVTPGVGTRVTLGGDTGDARVGTRVTNRTITSELEPNNYIDKKAKRATSISEPFALADTVVDALRKKHPSLDIGEQIDAFVDFHTAKGSVFKDWDAAFRTWCRNAVKFDKPKTVIHKQDVKPPAEGPTERGWVLKMHDIGEHWECRPGEFGCK